METETQTDQISTANADVLDKMKRDVPLTMDDLFALFSGHGYHAIEVDYGDGTGRRMSDESIDRLKQELAVQPAEHVCDDGASIQPGNGTAAG